MINNEIDLMEKVNSTSLNQLDDAIHSVCESESLTEGNINEVVSAVRGALEHPLLVLSDLLTYARSSSENLQFLASSFDEKEFWVRIFLRQRENYWIRLHIWLPSSTDADEIELVHSHRRYLVSYILNNEYTSFEYCRGQANCAQLQEARVIPAGSCYAIGPETIHSVANRSNHHTVSLIVRGTPQVDHLDVYDPDSMKLVSYVEQRPIRGLGKTSEENRMSREEYILYRLETIVRECGM